jgi:type II secretory ATPase GspE/PulE/Tfp pilus assembly ATPase PilB-like protein
MSVQRILTVVDFDGRKHESIDASLSLARQLQAELHVLMISRAGPGESSTGEVINGMESHPINEAPTSDNGQVIRTVANGPLLKIVKTYVVDRAVDCLVLDESCLPRSKELSFDEQVCEVLVEVHCPVLVIRSHASHESEHLLARAAELLVQHHGAAITGDHQQSLSKLQQTLQRELSLNQQEADRLFSELEAARCIRWEREIDRDRPTMMSSRGTWHLKTCSDIQAEAIEFEEVEENWAEVTAASSLLHRGIDARATDIHIDPKVPGEYVVRFRVDGKMQEYCRLQSDVARAIVKQFKVMANVSLADPFHPAESRLNLPPSLHQYEVRLTTAPVVNGEALALRLIARDKLYRPLNELGLTANAFATIYRMLHQKSGLVLVTGPTGAGKTTTVYSMLNVLFTEQQNIISIEDPVELVVPFMRQLNVDTLHGFTMRNGLSTILRMDPDVVFIGEIRDADAASIAMQAAACGKRAFSTMHMRDVTAAITAMRELRVDSKSLADNLTGIVSQRLIRRLCAACQVTSEPTKHERAFFERLGMDAPDEVARARGCAACSQTGYRGRIGVFEAIVVEGALAEAIKQEKDEAELRRMLQHSGWPTLLDDGLRRVAEGVTTLEEVQEMSWLPEVSIDELQPAAETLPGYQRGGPFRG